MHASSEYWSRFVGWPWPVAPKSFLASPKNQEMPPHMPALKAHLKACLQKNRNAHPHPTNRLQRKQNLWAWEGAICATCACAFPSQALKGATCQAGQRPSQSSQGRKINGVPFPHRFEFWCISVWQKPQEISPSAPFLTQISRHKVTYNALRFVPAGYPPCPSPCFGSYSFWMLSVKAMTKKKKIMIIKHYLQRHKTKQNTAGEQE